MNGAEAIVTTARDAGVDVCFANPGTTEMPLVAALASVGGIRPVLGVFEGVCTGAADGYARMTGRPAMTLLHLGPGLTNGIANLHNAQRARSPVLDVVGDNATWHVGLDSALESDIEGLAGPVSAWVRTSASADAMANDCADAIAAALAGGVATLILPQTSRPHPLRARCAVVLFLPSSPPTPRVSSPRLLASAARARPHSTSVAGRVCRLRSAKPHGSRRRPVVGSSRRAFRHAWSAARERRSSSASRTSLSRCPRHSPE